MEVTEEAIMIGTHGDIIIQPLQAGKCLEITRKLKDCKYDNRNIYCRPILGLASDEELSDDDDQSDNSNDEEEEEEEPPKKADDGKKKAEKKKLDTRGW